MENFREFLNREDGDGPLGKHVFPDEKLNPSKEAEGEPYTDLERHLEEMLEAHFGSGKNALPRNSSEQILDLIKNKNYPKIFKAYDSGKAYRGMSLSPDVFKKLFGKVPEKAKWYSAPIDWWHDRASKSGVSFPFSPEKKPGYSPARDTHAGSWSSSWAWDMGPAKYFAQKISHRKGNLPIVLVADASKNTFIDTKPLYKEFDFALDFRKEKEVIGVGDIQLLEIYVLPEPKKLKETKKPIPLPDMGNIALFHDPELDNHELVLYYLGDRGPFPFAACGIDRLSEITKGEQCIPETWHMSWIYVHEQFQGSGWSKILYGLAFNLVNKAGAGMTSDHWASTSDDAKTRGWDKMISRNQLTPRKTPGTPPTGGHSEFDYGDIGAKKTPLDPLDDCNPPGSGYDPATTSSWVMKGHAKFESIYRDLTENHENLMSAVADRDKVERKLSDDAANEFETAYTEN